MLLVQWLRYDDTLVLMASPRIFLGTKIMSKYVQAVRGMNDILPTQIKYWQHLESILHKLLMAYGYQEIRLPIVEPTQLFVRAVGEVTDIVEKEMYQFEDRNGDSLCLRPEGTAGCVRAGIEHGLLYNQIQRLWYQGPMFRHERPQKGRYRQFYQLGVEAFGLPGPDIDAEQLFLVGRLWQELGLSDIITLEINSLGSMESRQVYRNKLVDYFKEHFGELDEESKRRLNTNPLRILDSKNPALKECLDNAPQLMDYLDDQAAAHFKRLRELLDKAGIAYVVNPRLVRGLDYYCLTVYEWTTNKLGAQGTVCAGGRYDGLVELLGGKSTPAVGFALGFERVVALLEETLPLSSVPDVYIILMGEKAVVEGMVRAESWRRELPALQFVTGCGEGSFKTQFKRADKIGAQLALVLGEEELQNEKIAVKFLREEKEQVLIPLDEVVSYLKKSVTPRSL